MNRVIISMGSNTADGHEQMLNNLNWLKGTLCRFKTSHIYRTPALSEVDVYYYNAVVEGFTDLDFNHLQGLLKSREEACGRTLEARQKQQVPIDLDIVVWNRDILRKKDFDQKYFQIGWKALCG